MPQTKTISQRESDRRKQQREKKIVSAKFIPPESENERRETVSPIRNGRRNGDRGDGDDSDSADAPRRLHLDKRVDSLITSTPEGADDDLLTTQQIAGWFGTSQQWVELGRAKGYGPPYVKLAPGIIRYKRSVVVEWLREREFKRTSEYA